MVQWEAQYKELFTRQVARSTSFLSLDPAELKQQIIDALDNPVLVRSHLQPVKPSPVTPPTPTPAPAPVPEATAKPASTE